MEGVSSAAIEVLVQNLINVFKEEYSLIRGLDKEANQLQKTLGMIQSYLNDAEKKSITLDAPKLWLRDLEASAFDADNVLDQLTYHLLRKKVKKMNKVLSCFSSFNQIARPRNMALRIKQVNADFDSKNKTATELGLQSVVMNAAPTTYALHASFETDSLTLDRIFIGRDDAVSEIVDKLTQISGEEMISILAIVGMGGMGKTTLTRKVFNHEKIKARFGSLKWDEDREGERNDDKSLLEGLQPHADLKKLVIHGYKGKRFASWTQKMEVRDGPLNNLTEIKLNECWECEEIPMLGHLPNLKSLYLRGLKNVRIINSSFNKLTKLHVERLERLECFQDWLFYNNPNLSYLKIKECPMLRELPDGLHTLTCLEELSIYKCPNLKSIVWNSNIPGGGSGVGGGGGVFRRLSIEGCRELVELPRRMMESWAPTLETLDLKELSSLQNLPMVIECLAKSAAHLKELRIVGVPKFMGSCSVESWLCGRLSKIEIDVSVEWSRESSGSIKETVEGMLQGCCNSLTELKLKGMIDWDWLPGSIQHLVSVEELRLESLGIQELPEWLGNLSSLELLNLSSCNKLRRMPPGDAYKALTKLKMLDIKDSPELEVDSEWRNIPRLTIQVDGRRIKSGSKT